MLGVIMAGDQGEGDRVLSAVAEALAAEGLRLAGAVQENSDHPGGGPCDMDLRLLGAPGRIRISQSLGPGSSGCRLDPDGVERAAGLAAAAFDSGADLLIVNKFGKQEAEGGGFRQLIARAVGQGVPVLTAVKPVNRPAFDAFAEGLAEDLPRDPAALLDWVRAQRAG